MSAIAPFSEQPAVTVIKYGTTRYWAVYLHGELLAVTVYRKGALAVEEAITNLLEAGVQTDCPIPTSAQSRGEAVVV